MLILGYRQPQPKHLLTTSGPAGTVSTDGHHMDAKGQEQICGDLSLRPRSPVATASARGRRWDLISSLHLVQLVSRAAPKAETASGPAVCSQFSHLHISQHLSNNELLMPKASSLTKYYFPLHPAEAEARWLGESSGKKGLCPAMSTGSCSLFRNSIEIRSIPEAKSTPAWHTWGSSHESTAELPSHRRLSKPQHSSLGSLQPHCGSEGTPASLPTAGWWVQYKLHWGKGTTFSNPVSHLNHCCRVNSKENLQRSLP